MKLVEIKNKQDWNKFVCSFEHAEFLQSWEWGEISGGCQRLALINEKEILAGVSILNRRAGFFDYQYSPRGPLVKDWVDLQVAYKMLFSNIGKFTFLRLESPLAQKSINSLDKYHKEKTINLQPAKTLMLDLSSSSDDLLREMHQKTRYNIRLALKKNIQVREASQSDFGEFWKIMQATSERDSFSIHGLEHYQKILNTGSDLFKLYIAECEGKILAGGIFAFFGDTVTYVHGASSNENRQLMAPYALHWHIITLAQAHRYRYYDFYGIDKHKWPGVTRFKEGFGGTEYHYLGAIDLVGRLGYYKIYKILRRIRRSM